MSTRRLKARVHCEQARARTRLLDRVEVSGAGDDGPTSPMIGAPPDPFDTDAPWVQRTPFDKAEVLSRLSWEELRTFLVLAKFGSMNRVAAYLGVDIRRVSQQLQHLQTMVGSQIFVQSRAGTRLTAKGDDLARFLVRFDRDLHLLSADLSAESGKLDGTVKITVTDGLGMAFLAPALRSFSERFPRVQVHLKTPLSYRNLDDNQTDMMLGFQPDPSQGVTSRPLGFLHLLTVASRGYLEEHGLPTKANLEQHLFVDSEQYSSRSGVYDSWHRATKRGRVVHYCDTSLSYGMLVKSGHGIGLLGNYVMLEPAFVPLELDVHIAVQMYALALTERLRSRPVKAAFEFLTSLYGPSNSWFSEQMSLDADMPTFDADNLMLFDFRHL